MFQIALSLFHFSCQECVLDVSLALCKLLSPSSWRGRCVCIPTSHMTLPGSSLLPTPTWLCLSLSTYACCQLLQLHFPLSSKGRSCLASALCPSPCPASVVMETPLSPPGLQELGLSSTSDSTAQLGLCQLGQPHLFLLPFPQPLSQCLPIPHASTYFCCSHQIPLWSISLSGPIPSLELFH